MAANEALQQSLRGCVQRILEREWGESIAVERFEILREGKCFRAHLSSGSGGLPSSVIVKRAREEEGVPIDPDSASPNPAHRLLDEWASLEFLRNLGDEHHLAPLLYGGDRGSCAIVYEDFGPGSSLADALMGDSPDEAASALRAHAKAVACLHHLTSASEKLYVNLRDSLGPRVEFREGLGWTRLDYERKRIEKGLEAINIRPEPSFWDEYESMSVAVSRPGFFRAFVHNDSCPDNTWMSGNDLKLIDFERGGFHHRLIDAVYARMSMPHCYLANIVPMDVVREAEREYRERLDCIAGPKADGQQFEKELVHACFFWVVSSGIFRIEESLLEDTEWGISTWRQRVIHRLAALASACDEFEHMPATSRVAQEAKARLEGVWRTEPMPCFPSFR